MHRKPNRAAPGRGTVGRGEQVRKADTWVPSRMMSSPRPALMSAVPSCAPSTGVSSASLRPSALQVSALSELAKQHVGSLTSAPAAPYKRAMTPQERQKTAETLAKQVRVIALAYQRPAFLYAWTERIDPAGKSYAGSCVSVLQTEALGRALLTAAAAQSTDGQEASAGQGNSAEPSSDVAKPMTPQQIVRGLRDLISRSRPASTLSVHEMTLQRPASRLTALRSPELTSSCPGPLSQLYHPPSSQPCTPGSPSAGPRTPKRLGSRGGPLRASAPAGLLSCGMPRTPPDVWVNPNARVNTDSEERDRALLRSSMGNRAAADATGTASASASAAAARARLLASRARTPGALPDDSLAFTLPSRPATAAVAEGAASKLLGSGHVTKPRWGPGQPLYHFVPTRGLLYRTFAELDPGDTGKLTYSEFEEACVRCGLRQQQTQKLFDK